MATCTPTSSTTDSESNLDETDLDADEDEDDKLKCAIASLPILRPSCIYALLPFDTLCHLILRLPYPANGHPIEKALRKAAAWKGLAYVVATDSEFYTLVAASLYQQFWHRKNNEGYNQKFGASLANYFPPGASRHNRVMMVSLSALGQHIAMAARDWELQENGQRRKGGGAPFYMVDGGKMRVQWLRRLYELLERSSDTGSSSKEVEVEADVRDVQLTMEGGVIRIDGCASLDELRARMEELEEAGDQQQMGGNTNEDDDDDHDDDDDDDDVGGEGREDGARKRQKTSMVEPLSAVSSGSINVGKRYGRSEREEEKDDGGATPLPPLPSLLIHKTGREAETTSAVRSPLAMLPTRMPSSLLDPSPSPTPSPSPWSWPHSTFNMHMHATVMHTATVTDAAIHPFKTNHGVDVEGGVGGDVKVEVDLDLISTMMDMDSDGMEVKADAEADADVEGGSDIASSVFHTSAEQQSVIASGASSLSTRASSQQSNPTDDDLDVDSMAPGGMGRCMRMEVKMDGMASPSQEDRWEEFYPLPALAPMLTTMPSTGACMMDVNGPPPLPSLPQHPFPHTLVRNAMAPPQSSPCDFLKDD